MPVVCLLLFFLLGPLCGREVDHLAKGVAVIASAHDNRRHVNLIYVARCLLLNLHCSPCNDIVAVQLVALLEELGPGRNLELGFGDC